MISSLVVVGAFLLVLWALRPEDQQPQARRSFASPSSQTNAGVTDTLASSELTTNN